MTLPTPGLNNAKAFAAFVGAVVVALVIIRRVPQLRSLVGVLAPPTNE